MRAVHLAWGRPWQVQMHVWRASRALPSSKEAQMHARRASAGARKGHAGARRSDSTPKMTAATSAKAARAG